MSKHPFFQILSQVQTTPLVMGIVNVTPDSFSDGGRFFECNDAVAHALKLLDDGADLVDIGGESTRPGAKSVGLEEELRRVIPVVEGILEKRPDAVISVDTYRSQVAEKAIELGALMINDISAGTFDPEMYKVVAAHDVIYSLMHIQKNPETMQQNPTYNDVVEEVRQWLEDRVKDACKAGCRPEQLMIDPGIGFGKTVEHNLKLIASVNQLNIMNIPLLLGVSRKSFFGKLPGLHPMQAQRLKEPNNRDLLTAVVSALVSTQPCCLPHENNSENDMQQPIRRKLVAMLRVHDVASTRDALSLTSALNQSHSGKSI